MFEGAIPALVTPFKEDGEIDESGYRENIEFLIENGVSAIVPCGCTGEAATLSFEEHKKLIDVAIDCSTVPVIAGTGSNNTKEAIELTKHANDAGADGALIITPYYNKPNDTGMKKHYKSVAEAVDIPIILYNVPSRTGINLKPEIVAELATLPNIIGVKEASGNLGQISDIIMQTQDQDFIVLSGDDLLTLPILALGGVGVISVAANIVPKKVADLCNTFKKGDIESARKIHYELAPLFRALFLETNPIPVKCATKLIGLASGDPRLPLASISNDNEQKLKEVLSNLEVR
ncbi:MAG TPA: 4-hydroxy-tetrahydrodipicolinate synthase [Methanosarcinales archaeon]|nr:4-hydroxy-tetrahydrodipicolinate synthase [Methanosarcinales archaeon]